MLERHRPGGREDREAQRALLVEALAKLPDEPDRERAAADIMRALDHYIESSSGAPVPGHREPPVADFAHREERETKWAMWVVLGGAALATAVVGVALSGGWTAALAIVAIWVIALAALLST